MIKAGIGKTPVGTKWSGHNLMSNPFNITLLSESDARLMIKKAGFKVKKIKGICLQPVGESDAVYEFIESIIENRISVMNNGITI